MAVPNVSYTVEVAFNAGYRTPAASRVWTDVSAYAELHEGMSVTYGRTDEISVADANQFTVTLDNKDGRFTWGNAASPYYPNIKIGRPIRLTATIGGVDYVRFTGYVNEWPVEWPGGAENYATATLTNSSRLSRLGLDAPLDSPLEQAIRRVNPWRFFRLDDAEGATTAADYSGDVALALQPGSQTPSFGVDMGNGMTGMTGSVELDGQIASPAAFSFSVFAKIPTPPPAFGTFLVGQLGQQRMYIDDSGFAVVSLPGVGTMFGPNVCDDQVHHLAFTYDGATANLYVDVALEDTAAGVAVMADEWLRIGSSGVTVSRAAWYTSALSAAEVEDIALSGLTGYSGETTDERLARYALWARIPTAELSTTPSPVLMTPLTGDGSQITELMRQVETTEAGVLYDNRAGNLVMKPRTARYGTALALTVDFDDHKVGVDYSPKVERGGLANVGKGTNTLGTIEARYTDETSREEYGDAGYDVETAALNPDEPLQLVAWQVNANAEPRPRAPSVTVDVPPWIGDASLPALLALDIGSRIRLTNSPTQAPSATVDYFIEGYSETFGVGSWSITFNLSPVAPYDAVFVLNDATLGKLDTGVLAL